MRILVVGGTKFVGRHLVEAALQRGHEVTVLHRGISGADLFGPAEHLLADRDGDLSVLADRSFDATVDVCAYRPGQVASLAAALGAGAGNAGVGRGGRHLFVSTVSVYAPPDGPGFTESALLLPAAGPDVYEVTDATYGPLKVACERLARDVYGPGLLIVRPTYVVGPHDHTWRFPSWVRRIAAGGRVLCPGPQDAPMQIIDARDQGAFMVRLLERADSPPDGTFHAASPAPPFSFGDLLEAVAAQVAPAGTTLEWLDEELLLATGLPERALPLWGWGGQDGWALAADPAAALAAGLAPRPLAQTVQEIAAWVRQSGPPPAGTGLTPEQEAALLSRA